MRLFLAAAIWVSLLGRAFGLATCALGGTVYAIDGSLAANARVTFQVRNTQLLTGAVIRKSTATVLTNSSGVLPTFNAPQGLVVFVTVGDGTPTPITIPPQSSADLSTLLPALH